MNIGEIKNLLTTRMLLSMGGGSNDMYGIIIGIIIITVLNWAFTAIPEYYKSYSAKITEKANTLINNSTSTLKSKITFKRSYVEDGAGYEVTDSLIDYLSNHDATENLSHRKFYLLNSNKAFKITDDVECKLTRVLYKDTGQPETITFEIYSNTLQLTELRRFINKIHSQQELLKANKFGEDRFFFDETPCQSNSKYLNFTMTKFDTNKSLNTLYGDKIKVLRDRINLFSNNEAWYEKNGIPHTLGIMLSGNVGTGKSSCIKAIAKDLDRHIINLKLTKETTQTQLWNLFYSNVIYSMSDGINLTRHTIPTDKRIYVLEDVDCLTDVLLNRETKSLEKEDKSDVNSYMARLNTDNNNAQKINLSFLLNILDGILETPGRILIMTSNYPEKIDKAILRPGRIDINLVLSNCSANTIKKMFDNFYTKVFEEELFVDFEGKYTPALVQKILSDNFENSDKAIEELRELDKAVKPEEVVKEIVIKPEEVVKEIVIKPEEVVKEIVIKPEEVVKDTEPLYIESEEIHQKLLNRIKGDMPEFDLLEKSSFSDPKIIEIGERYLKSSGRTTDKKYKNYSELPGKLTYKEEYKKLLTANQVKMSAEGYLIPV